MKLTVTTAVLQSMVAKSMKGASCNKMIPITGFMNICLKDGVLSLATTDASNYWYVREDHIGGEDFEVVVQADMFAKLVSKMTSEKITLELKDSILYVKGNGNYSIELPLDEEGELVKFPNPLDTFVGKDEDEIKLSTVKLICATAKSALATSDEIPCYTGYYAGSSVIATDTYKICGIAIKLFDTPALVSVEMMNLLELMDTENISVGFADNNAVVFETESCAVYGHFMDCVDDFQVEPISGLLEQEFASSCKISKNALLQLLDRLSLFVTPYDKNGIYLTFTRNGLQVDSKKANSCEVIEYLESSKFADFTCCIDIEMLASQVKANTGDSIEIQYGEDNAIKLTDGNVTQIIALLEDDRLDSEE